MIKWFCNKNEIADKMIITALRDLETLIDYDKLQTKAKSYWLDSCHNIQAWVNDNLDSDCWIEVHYTLCDLHGHGIGDIMTWETDELNKQELKEIVTEIVDMYLNEV